MVVVAAAGKEGVVGEVELMGVKGSSKTIDSDVTIVPPGVVRRGEGHTSVKGDEGSDRLRRRGCRWRALVLFAFVELGEVVAGKVMIPPPLTLPPLLLAGATSTTPNWFFSLKTPP